MGRHEFKHVCRSLVVPVVYKFKGSRCRHPRHYRQAVAQHCGVRCNALVWVVYGLMLLMIRAGDMLLLLLLLLEVVKSVLSVAVALVQVGGEAAPPAQRQHFCMGACVCAVAEALLSFQHAWGMVNRQ